MLLLYMAMKHLLVLGVIAVEKHQDQRIFQKPVGVGAGAVAGWKDSVVSSMERLRSSGGHWGS